MRSAALLSTSSPPRPLRTSTRRVADVVLRKLHELAPPEEMAQAWLDTGLVTRKLCKKPVMTLPYGAKQYGMRSGIAEFMAKPRRGGQGPLPEGRAVFAYASTSWATSGRAIGEVVVAAREAMDFLQECAGGR
jgi:DNA-directed RNA polymerase